MFVEQFLRRAGCYLPMVMRVFHLHFIFGDESYN